MNMDERPSQHEFDACKMSAGRQNGFPQIIKNDLDELLMVDPENSHAIFELVQNTVDYVLQMKLHLSDECDAFKMSAGRQNGFPWTIKNELDELLIVHPENSHAIFEPLQDTVEEQATLYLQIYGEDAHRRSGLPVAISCKIGKINYVLKAGNVESDEVYVEEHKLPPEISTKTSELIFYLQEFSIGYKSFCFESSLKEGFFLAWNAEKKLILKPKPKVFIDETLNFFLVRKY
ncbi:interleukin-18 isoform X3 [Phyllobates terribilis]|uniref:interleukin-18 isoform X3 n=1 Tax=Phyllobates terribilis TaxID=111132 RepID=UPI003CCA89F7